MSIYTVAPDAAADLAELWAYINLDSPANASGVMDAIERACELLAEYPRLGRDRPEIRVGLRSFPVSSFIIYYEVSAKGIGVLRVLHGARDPESAMG